jgi:hypothetical protein
MRNATRRSLLLFLLLCFALAAAPVVRALGGSLFEATDGDLVSAGGVDWDGVLGQLDVGYDEPTGQTDDSLGGKEDDPAPSVEFGSIPNNKSDLLRFYVHHESVPEGDAERDFLYLAWVRANTLGTANMDFEFNQAKQISSNGRTSVRTDGDVLITFAFTGNNNVVQLGLSLWTTTGPCEASSTTPCWGPLMPLTGIAEGSVNASSVVDPISGATLAAGTFGEAAIDLTEAGVFDRDECVSFGSAYVKSRSADSFSSTMKDFIRPIDVSVTNCATVVIRKNAVPDDAQDFAFTPSASLSSTDVVLDDDPSSPTPDSHTFFGRFSGQLSVLEPPVAGWDLTGLSCAGPGAPERDASGALTGRVTILAATGTTVDCTWVNTKRGRLVVDEVTQPGGDPQSFGFSVGGGPDAFAATFSLTGSDTPWTSSAVRPGTYSVVQGDDGPNWDLTSVVCSDGSPANAIVVDPGETVTCTFTNVKRGTIAVDVVTTPSGDSQMFPFTLSGGPDSVNQSFSLADASAPHVSGSLRAGTYAVAAGAAPAGWDLSSSSCADGSTPSAVGLSAGESVTCTFVYVKRGTIRVDVVTAPSADPQTFPFTLSGGPDAVNQSFALADQTAPYASGFLRAGTYAVMAGALPAGWDLGSSSCSDGSAPSSIGLAPAETVTCTFVYVKRGTISVDVITTPSGDPTSIPFSLTGGPDAVNQSFALADPTPPYSSGLVRAGTYAVTAGAAGPMLDLASATCSDGSAPGAIVLSAGESVLCTFRYVKRAQIVVSKIVTNEPPAGMVWDPIAIPFPFSAGWGASFTLHHGESYTSPWIASQRSYAINESADAKWSTTSECIRGDGSRVTGGSSISVTPQPGEQIACTFYNELSMHAGSAGFWRNWSNHYTTAQLREILDASLDGSPIFASLFDPYTGALRSDAVSDIDAIYAANGTLSHLMRELTSTFLNLGVSTEPSIQGYQNNDDICLDCVLDLDEIPGAEELLRSLAPCELPEALRVADLIAVAEAAWTGNVSTETWTFAGLTDSQIVILDNVFGGINQGNVLIADVTKYPGELTCVAVPGPVTYTWYRDADGDGHGVLSPRTQTCDGQAPAGYTASRDDCNDGNGSVWPGAPEVCDGIANDCRAPGWPTPVNEVEDGDGDGKSECAGDCNDSDKNVYPGAIELCDGKATDCSNGSWPLAPAWDRDDDGDSLSECAGDCDDTRSAVRPGAPQVCDGVNDNCSDPAWPAIPAGEADVDHDGYPACNDCNDSLAAVHPGVAEKCNGLDDDCNGLADDGPAGLDPDHDGRASACDNCPIVWNDRQGDVDRDGRGDACDNCPEAPNPNQANADADSRGDVCDSCPTTVDDPTQDLDHDAVSDVCDNCLNEPNRAQTDLDADGEGDACDWNDGSIYLRFESQTLLVWDAEAGQQSWTCLRGDLDVLRSTGNASQAEGTNALAAVHSGILHPWMIDSDPIPAGHCAFYLINSP